MPVSIAAVQVVDLDVVAMRANAIGGYPRKVPGVQGSDCYPEGGDATASTLSAGVSRM